MKTVQGRPTVFVDDIVGISQIAERTERTRGAVQKWRQRFDDFPAPITNIGSDGTGSQPVWDWVQVERFLAEHPRLGS